MIQYSNISLLATPSDDSHVITVGYGRATYAAKVHVHAISDVTGLAAELATFVTQTALGQALTNYVTGAELTATLADYATTASVTSTLAGYVTSAALSQTLTDYVTDTDLTATLASYATVASLAGYSVTSHQHTVEPVDGVPASGIITLARDKTQYKKTVTANTVIGFNAAGLGLASNDAATFELLIVQGSRAYQVLFGGTVTWLNGEEPLFNTPNTSYLCAFRTYDGGASWVGSYEGQF